LNTLLILFTYFPKLIRRSPSAAPDSAGVDIATFDSAFY
jgi:hypothetical protein